MKKIICLAILVFNINLIVGTAQQTKTIKPISTWTGGEVDRQWLKNDSNTFKEAILNEADWTELWQTWRHDRVPKINFAENLILFCTTTTPNHCSIEPKLSSSGDLKVKILTTLMYTNAATFDYKIILINRAGIKTINGKAVAPTNRRDKKGRL